MGLLTRLLEKVDDNLHVDIPQPRDPATNENVRQLRPEHTPPEDVAR